MEFEPAPRGFEAQRTPERREGERAPLPRIVALMIENERGELLCQRRAGERHNGSWTVSAGGHQYEGESDQTTLVRETEEEIGVRPPGDVQRGLELHYPGAPDARASWIQCYTATVRNPVFDFELNPREVSEIAWKHPEELLDPATHLQPEFRHILERREALKHAPFAVIWNMDDTLFPSKLHLLPVFEEATYRLSGIRPPEALLSAYVGRSLRGFCELVSQGIGISIDHDRFAELVNEIESEVHDRVGVLPYQAIPAFLASLEGQGVGNAVGTNSPVLRARQVLDRLRIRERMSALVGIEDVQLPKPAPDMFLEAARRLGVPPERCIVFEDSPGGLLAAKEAGMVPVALDVGVHTTDELALASLVTPHYEDLSFAHLAELITDHQQKR
ncbi:MAG: HAD-IA family hydrolase [Patescibacteria group bacterium]|jgi:beta-phosphoglucomutase-like phosphatase (HAD superfamily)/isopentenyldiphosphate isomerase